MSSQLRKQEHLKGQAMMRAENYFSALEIFLKAWEKYGPHVGLLSDIAASYYMLGRIEDYHQILGRLEKELREALEILAPDSAARTFLFLGKLVEEQGQVMKALEFYRAARDLCEKTAPEIRVQAQVQVLRLQSFLGNRDGLAELYQICLKLQTQSQDLQVELNHGLILAETVLFGLEMGVARAHNLFAEKKVFPFDQRLIVMDLIDEALRQHLPSDNLMGLLNQTVMNEADLFEMTLAELYRDPHKKLSVYEINQLAAQIPWMGALRLISIALDREMDTKARAEMERRFQFMLEPLDSNSKLRLSRKFLPSSESFQQMGYSVKKRILRMEGRHLNLKEGSLAAICFGHLSQNDAISLQELSSALGLDVGVDSYDRLRIALWRANKALQLFTGKNRTFIFSKSAISLNPAFKLSNF